MSGVSFAQKRLKLSRHRMPIIFELEQQFQAEFGTSFQDYVDFVNFISYRFKKLIMDIIISLFLDKAAFVREFPQETVYPCFYGVEVVCRALQKNLGDIAPRGR
jgi:hypothetical protein